VGRPQRDPEDPSWEYGRKHLARVWHVDPNYEYYFNQYFSLKGLYSYSTSDYYSSANSALDNRKNRYELTSSFYLADRRHIVSATAGYEHHNADADRFTYDAPYRALSYFANFQTNTEFFIRCQSIRKDYDERPLLYNKDRKDKRHSFTVVLSQGFLKYFFASFSFSYTDNDSNCKLYDFDKRTYTISTGCRF
jgi:hypothetical protein